MTARIKTLIVLLTVLCVVLSGFQCIEKEVIYNEKLFLYDRDATEPLIELTSFFWWHLAIGVIQIMATVTDLKYSRLCGILSSIVGFIHALGLPIGGFLSQLYQPFGGLGYTEYTLTFFGYSVIILSLAIVVLQIMLCRFFNRKRCEENCG